MCLCADESIAVSSGAYIAGDLWIVDLDHRGLVVSFVFEILHQPATNIRGSVLLESIIVLLAITIFHLSAGMAFLSRVMVSRS